MYPFQNYLNFTSIKSMFAVFVKKTIGLPAFPPSLLVGLNTGTYPNI